MDTRISVLVGVVCMNAQKQLYSLSLFYELHENTKYKNKHDDDDEAGENSWGFCGMRQLLFTTCHA